MKPTILLIGGGGHCRSVIDVIEQEDKFTIAGIIDRSELLGQKVLGYEVIGTDDQLPNLARQHQYALVTAGQIESSELRERLYALAKNAGFVLPPIISPRAYVSPHAQVGQGSVVMHFACINAAAEVGDNCIINTKALIEHDAIIGNYCHISTGAIVNGGVQVAPNTFFGSNATSKQYVKAQGFIKAGSVVK